MKLLQTSDNIIESPPICLWLHECIKSHSIHTCSFIYNLLCLGLFFFIVDEEVDRVNPLCTTSKFSWKMNIRSVLFKPSIFRQWLCDVQVLERLWQGYTLCNLFGNHSLETHSSPCFIKGSLEYSGPSRKFFNARGSESIIERFQNQLQYDCKRSINHR